MKASPENRNGVAGTSDAELLALIAKGDSEAWSKLYLHYASRVYSLVKRILIDQQAAEDALQETFLRIKEYAKSYSDPENGGSARGWILRIASREALKIVNRSKLRMKREDNSASDAVINGRAVSLEERREDMASREMGQLLRASVDQLPEVERQIITLRFACGMTQEQIAGVLKCSQRTVSGRLKTGLEYLRKKLGVVGAGAMSGVMDGMGTTLLEGELPEEISQRVFENIKDLSVPPSGSAVGKADSALRLGVPLALAVSAMIGVALALNRGNDESQSMPQVVAQVNEEDAGNKLIQWPPADSVNRTWNFQDQAASKDFRFLQGKWNWKPGQGKGNGCMQSDPGYLSVVPLPMLRPKGPFVVKVQVATLADINASYGISMFIGRSKEGDPQTDVTGGWKGSHLKLKNKTHVYHFYGKGAYTWKMVEGSIRYVREYEHPENQPYLLLFFANVRIEEISFTLLSPDEFPANLKNPRKLKLDRMGNVWKPQWINGLVPDRFAGPGALTGP